MEVTARCWPARTWQSTLATTAASTLADTLLPVASLRAALLRALLLLDTATMAEPIMVTFGDIGMVGGMPTASVPVAIDARWLLRLGLYIVEVAAALAARSNDATDEA